MSGGLIHSYIHHDGSKGALVHLSCQTDFVSRTPEFKAVANGVAMQATFRGPMTVEELLATETISPDFSTVTTLAEGLEQKSKLFGEKITIENFVYMELNK